MRTSRLGRWLISGVLVAAAAAIVHGGQTVESGIGVTALSSESALDDTTVVEPAVVEDAGAQPMTTTGYEWG
jgi:hypothetical protein